jgi:hypothetical protein
MSTSAPASVLGSRIGNSARSNDGLMSPAHALHSKPAHDFETAIRLDVQGNARPIPAFRAVTWKMHV